MKIFRLLSNFFDRLWKGNTQQDKREETHAKHMISQMSQTRERINESLARLLFEQKKVDEKLKKVSQMLSEHKVNLHEAALDDRDELAIHIMEDTQELQAEYEFLYSHKNTLDSDITRLKESKKELDHQIHRAKSSLDVLSARIKTLNVRKDLKAQLNNINTSVESIEIGPLNESVLRVEAQIEAMESSEPKWKNELKQMRKDRKRVHQVHQLDLLKKKLRSELLPQPITLEPALTIRSK